MLKNTDQSNHEEFVKDRKNAWAVNLGLGANVLLACLKVVFGIFGRSPALLADGINSTSDVIYYIAAKVFLRISVQPADPEHPYGHRQMENISAIVVGSFILTTAVAIFWNSLDSVYDILMRPSEAVKSAGITLVIALGTVALKILLTVVTRRIAKDTGSHTVRALAHDHLNDVFASLAAALGIFFGRYGYPWVDPLAGGVVALFILKTGVEIIRESSLGLMDTAPDQELKERVLGMAGETAGIIHVETIRMRRFGQYIVLNLDICVDGSLSIRQGDRISDILEARLLNSLDNLVDVHIHYHPGKADEDGKR